MQAAELFKPLLLRKVLIAAGPEKVLQQARLHNNTALQLQSKTFRAPLTGRLHYSCNAQKKPKLVDNVIGLELTGHRRFPAVGILGVLGVGLLHDDDQG